MGGKRLLIFLLVFLLGFLNATPTFPVGEKTVKNDWFQCFETTSAGEIIVKECMTGAVGCFVDVLEQKDGRYEVSEARGCAFVDKPFSEDNQQFVCKTPRCNSLEKYPANETFMPCYVLDNAGNSKIQLCETKSCFVKKSPSSYVENRGCWNDSDVIGDDVVVCDIPKCNAAEKYPILDPKGHFCYKYDGAPGNHEVLVNCPNQNCVVSILNGFALSWGYDRDCAYDQAFDDSHWICSTPGCNSLKNYPAGDSFFACYEGGVSGDIKLKICTEHIVGCYVQVLEDKDGNCVHTASRGCALVNEPFSKKNMQFICYGSLCNSQKDYPVNGIAFSCYASDGKEDVYLKPCPQERYHKIDSCDVEYKLDPTNNVTVYTHKRDCGSKHLSHVGFEQTRRCDTSRCNSLENFAPNQAVFQCFGNDESSTEVCNICQCYIKTKNVDEGGVTFTNDRGCFEKLNANMENALTCNISLCNSFDNYPIVDLENDTNICFKTFGDHTALVKCPSNHCEIGIQKNEDGNYVYTGKRGCAVVDEPFNKTAVQFICFGSRCNNEKDYPVNGIGFSCYASDGEEDVYLKPCPAGIKSCDVEYKLDPKNNVTVYTQKRDCASENLSHDGFEQTRRCDSSSCNSLEKFTPNQEVFDCFGSDENSIEICKTYQCYVIIKNIDGDEVTFTNERGCIEKLNGNVENVLTCNTSLCNSYKDYPVVDLEKDTNICYKSFADHCVSVKCPNNKCEIGIQKNEDGNLMYTKHRDCGLSDKPFDEENMTMTCSTSRCNSLKDLPINETFFACLKNGADGKFSFQTCSDDDVGCYVKVADNWGIYSDRLHFYTVERGCANKTMVDHIMIHVCNSSLCNSLGQFPVNGKAMSCYVRNDQEEKVNYEPCKVGAVGCFVEILNQNGYKYSKIRGCAYDDKPFSDDNMRITCKSPRCNSFDNHEPFKDVLSCVSSDLDSRPQICKNHQCYIKIDNSSSDDKIFLKERGCANDSTPSSSFFCKTSMCNSFEKYPVLDLESKDTVICSKADDDTIFFVNCPIVPDKPLCSFAKDVHFYGGYRRDCYQDSSQLKHCNEPKCNRVEAYLRCFDSDNNLELCRWHTSCKVVYDEKQVVVFRGCGNTYSVGGVRIVGIEVVCEEDKCNSKEKYP